MGSETCYLDHRFSAFWLRSKCSICSYQLNIWYGLHSRSRILNWFLTDWNHGWACSPDSAGCHGIALPPCSSLFRKRSHLLYPKCYLHNAVNLLLWQKTVQMITKQHFIPNFLTSKIIKNNVISSEKVWDDCDCIFFCKKTSKSTFNQRLSEKILKGKPYWKWIHFTEKLTYYLHLFKVSINS